VEEKKEYKPRRKKVETQEEKPVSEWKERVVQIRRVTKVVKGGKKLSFRAIVIVGNQKGQVGVGCAKAAEVIIAIQKAIADGEKILSKCLFLKQLFLTLSLVAQVLVALCLDLLLKVQGLSPVVRFVQL